MRTHFLSLLCLLLLSVPLRAQVVYEDFESGAQLNWNAPNGTFGGVFANPDPNFVNSSDSVGSYTKSDQHSFSLFLAEVSTPLDLSVNNQFSIQVYSPIRSRFILKLEGSQGAIEGSRFIANANVWQEYTFDFSAAAGTDSLTKIILFFDYGVTASAETFLFDNIAASPAGPCAGTTPDPDIIDDFECQRNASYTGGWDRIEAIANPDPSGINTSASVGRYPDPLDQWSALGIRYYDPIDLSSKNTLAVKVWAPKTGQLLFKLEGGVSPAAEIFVPVTQTNQWVEYKADFSDQAAASHQQISIFFNAGVTADSGDVYFVDDIRREETPQGNVIEDFEPQLLTWEPANGDAAIHGVFTRIANPDASGVNVSDFVGQYVKGSSPFSTLTAALPAALDLSAFSQLNLQVWVPTGTQTVTMQLSSPTQGIKSVEQTPSETQAWTDLVFDFSNFDAITDFDRLNLLFDPGVATSQNYYFDNLTQGENTTDPCEGIDPLPNFLDDFECQRNVTYGAGNERLEVVNNPDVNLGNASTKVGEYTDPNDEWSALVVDFGGPVDLGLYNQFKIKIWAPAVVPLLFKLEGGSSPAVEVPVTVSAASSWEEYTVDFSGQAGENHTRLAIFFNAGVNPGGEDIYYIDDLRMSRGVFTGCITHFESPAFTLAGWTYFANGSLDDTEFEVVTNPDQSGVNTSANVGIFLEAADGQTFAGMFANPEAPITLPNDNKTIRMKVWSPDATQMVMKLEQPLDGAPNSGDIIADYANAGQWEELTFDFSAIVPDDAQYARITLILGFGETPAADRTMYFDDIAIGDADCANITALDRPQLAQLRAYPNPTSQYLTVQSPQPLTRLEVHNLMGQQVLSVTLTRQTEAQLDLSTLKAGLYLLTGYAGDKQVARSRVIKE